MDTLIHFKIYSPGQTIVNSTKEEVPLKVRRALISVSDKRGVVDLAKALIRYGVKIISTGGTHRYSRTQELMSRLCQKQPAFRKSLMAA